MPRANKRKTAESSAPARRSSRTPAKAEATPTKQTRATSSDASPAKTTRKASPSPAPKNRGRSAKVEETKSPQKGQGDSPVVQGRVTRAVVKDKEEENVTSRGRSTGRKSEKAKEVAKVEPTEGRSSRSKSGTPSKSTPKKKEMPKGGRSRSARGKAKEEEVESDEEEEEEEEEEEPPKETASKSTPKGRATGKSPAKATSPTPAKKSPKTTPKQAASRSRSRGGKKDEVTSPQVVLEKMEASDIQTRTGEKVEKEEEAKQVTEVISPRARRAKKEVTKTTPSPSVRSSRSRRGAQKEESVEVAKEETVTDKTESSTIEEKTTKDEETEAAMNFQEEQKETEEDTGEEKMEEKNDEKEVQDMDTAEDEKQETSEEEKQDAAESEESAEPDKSETADLEEKPSDDMQTESENVEDGANQKSEPQVEEPEQEEAAVKLDEQEPSEETGPIIVEVDKEQAASEESAPVIVDGDKEQSTSEESGPVVVEEEKEQVPEINITPATDAVEISDEDAPSSTVVEPAESVQISDESEDVPDIKQSEPIQVDEESSEFAPLNSVDQEPDEMEVDTNEGTTISGETGSAEQPVCIDGEQNGQVGSRKRKIDEVEETEDDAVSKKACVSESEIVEQVQANGETLQPSEKEVSAKVTTTTTQYMDDVTAHTTEEDYVMINLADVPDSNSKEVLESLPNNKEPAQQSTDNTGSVKSNSDSIDKLGPLLNRRFIQNPSFSVEGSDPSKQFSVVSYNILAQCHLARNDYSFTSSEYLDLEHRHHKMMKEIQYLDGDVVCLQEVGPQYFDNMLEPAMKSMGYSGIMKKRTQEYFDEGEATFWKNSRFTLVKSETHSLARLADKEIEDAALNEELQTAVMQYLDMPDVVILTQLRCNFTNNTVTIGNIHVQWGKMEVPDVQCIQIVCAIKALLSLAGNDTNPHILCGDFNSENTSPGYQLVLEGYLSDDKIDELQGLEKLHLPDGSKKALFNQLYRAFQNPSSNIKSSYLTTLGKEPKVTSYNRVMRAAVDYIFYSANSLDNVGVLEVAAESTITETGGIPDATFPSDHVSIKSVLSFK